MPNGRQGCHYCPATRQRREIEELRELVLQLRDKIAKLEKNSSNSSKPPVPTENPIRLFLVYKKGGFDVGIVFAAQAKKGAVQRATPFRTCSQNFEITMVIKIIFAQILPSRIKRSSFSRSEEVFR
jgi:hypothetical protein